MRSACFAAQAVGLHIGMPLAQAQALVPDLQVADATLEEDEASLEDLALGSALRTRRRSRCARSCLWSAS